MIIELNNGSIYFNIKDIKMTKNPNIVILISTNNTEYNVIAQSIISINRYEINI